MDDGSRDIDTLTPKEEEKADLCKFIFLRILITGLQVERWYPHCGQIIQYHYLNVLTDMPNGESSK